MKKLFLCLIVVSIVGCSTGSIPSVVIPPAKEAGTPYPLSSKIDVERLPCWPPCHSHVGPPPSQGPSGIQSYTFDTVTECGQTCNGFPDGTVNYIPTYEWMSASYDLALAWTRAKVVQGIIPAINPSWVQLYPQVNFCKNKLWVWAAFTRDPVTGAGIGSWGCAASLCNRDNIVVSVPEPARVKQLTAWEFCNHTVTVRINQPNLGDSQFVGDCYSFVMANNP